MKGISFAGISHLRKICIVMSDVANMFLAQKGAHFSAGLVGYEIPQWLQDLVS